MQVLYPAANATGILAGWMCGKKPAKAGAKLSDACWLLYLQPEDGCL